MSLYEYAMPVEREDADAYVAAVREHRAKGFFCNDYFSQFPVVNRLAKKYSFKSALSLGRPWTGEGESYLTGFLRESGLDYDSPIVLDEKNGGLLLGLGCRLDDEQRQWVIKNAGKSIILINDNEWE